MAAARADWAVGYADEVWWSRVAVPGLSAWTEAGPPRRLVEPSVPAGEPKALACYGVLLAGLPAAAGVGTAGAATDPVWLRFVDGRPVSGLTTQFLAWAAEQAAAAGLTTLVWIWDNAAWHCSKAVRAALRTHNQRVQRTGGVKIVPCWLPTKSPWLNPIEPKWAHGKRRVAEPARLLTAEEVETRVYAALGAAHADHLSLPQQVA